MVWIQIRNDKILVLIWVQTVCKGYQQRTEVATSKEEFIFFFFFAKGIFNHFIRQKLIKFFCLFYRQISQHLRFSHVSSRARGLKFCSESCSTQGSTRARGLKFDLCLHLLLMWHELCLEKLRCQKYQNLTGP